jgi:hypothetical protein
MFEGAIGARLAVTAYRLQRALRDSTWRGLDHAEIVRGDKFSERDRDGQKDRRTDQREQKYSFHPFFSIPLMWTHYSPASRRDAKIDISRIKLTNRDSAVLTPDESG